MNIVDIKLALACGLVCPGLWPGVMDQSGPEQWETVYEGTVTTAALSTGAGYGSRAVISSSSASNPAVGLTRSDVVRMTINGAASQAFQAHDLSAPTVSTWNAIFGNVYLTELLYAESAEEISVPDTGYDFALEKMIMYGVYEFCYFYARTPGTYNIKLEKLST